MMNLMMRRKCSDNPDSDYDLEITQQNVPLMNLKQTSYIRTHKQSVVHAGELTREIVDFRGEYPDIYVDALAKMEKFQKKIISNAF